MYYTDKERVKVYHRKYYETHKKQALKQAKKWHQLHREEERNWRRIHILRTTINGKYIYMSGLNKRVYSNYCELCGILKTQGLHYHHWNKNNPNLGIWVCYRCHTIIEVMDQNILQKIVTRYLNLKKILSS